MIDLITPDDIKAPIYKIPDEVFEAFNELISKKWNGTYSKVFQNEVVKLIIEKLKENGISATYQFLLDNRFLDIEPYYEKVGWNVRYLKQKDNDSFLFYKKS